MKDWMNNEIKVGQTLVIVKVKQMFCGFIRNAITGEKLGEFPEEKEYWNIEDEYDVREIDGIIGFVEGDIFFILSNTKPSDFWLVDRIACIKGISDSKELYYASTKK